MTSENWGQGDAYERFMGRWSRRVAAAFVAWLDRPAGGRWLDAGCGSGALSDAIAQRCAPASLVGFDRSGAYVRHARSAARGRRALAVADATALPFRDAAVDAAVSGLMLNFVPAPDRAVAELRRATRRGGVVAVYVWDYAEGMEMLRRFWDAAIELDPAARPLDEGVRFPLCGPDPLRALFVEAGCRRVEVAPVEATTEFEDFDDAWEPFLGGQGPAPGYVASLPDDARAALRDALRRRLPASDDGAIRLRARAWAVRGEA